MLDLDGQVHHDTHAVPMGNYVIEVGNYVIATPSELGNYKIADSHAAASNEGRASPGRPGRHAPGYLGGARLANSMDHATALVGCMVECARGPAAASPDQLGQGRPPPAPLHIKLTNHR